MASLFEQYEKAAQQSADLVTAFRLPQTERSVSHIVPFPNEDKEPIFNKRRINFSVPSPLTCLAASNGQLAFAMANKTILRLDIKAPDQRDEVDLTKAGLNDSVSQVKIGRLFLDVTGNHLLIILVMQRDGAEVPFDVLYLNRKTKRPRSTNKMKNHVVNAVAWDYRNTSVTSTGPILVGTNRGVIFETALNVVDDRYPTLSNVEQYWKQLFDFGKDGPTCITGIEYHVLPGNDNICFILVTTPTRLYQFFGTVPSFADHPVMAGIFNNSPDIPVRFLELPSQLPYSQLQFFYPGPQELPKAFAWMTGAGILYYSMNYSGDAGPNTIPTKGTLVNYPKDAEAQQLPLAVVLTEFHVLVLYRDRVKGVCILNEQPVMEDVFTEMYGSLVQLVKDPITGTIWVCSEYALYRYNVSRETRHVWQVYLSRGDYTMAQEYCQDDPLSLDVVLTKQAEDFFVQKKYDRSALQYAKTRVAFEVVALRFLQAEQKSALQVFLKQKLAGLRVQDKTQKTMIVIWLVELYLNRLGELRDARRQGVTTDESLQQEFYHFLSVPNVKEIVTSNSNTVYDLIASHGDREALVTFAMLIEDYERVIRIHLENANYMSALSMFRDHKLVALFYQFCPQLMQFIPTETTNVCIGLGRRLDPTKLIPALVHYNDNSMKPSTKNEAIRYLEFCVRTLDEKERTIHNYLLSLYAKHLPERLEPYLNAQGQDPATVCYDLEYALRVCSEYGHYSACIHIYAVMGLYEEAVDLALKFDVEKAKQYADRPEENEELRKKLWLKIAHYVVQEENDIKRAMEFLQQCELIKIEDILPFFPNFVTIDHFKDAIVQSLHEYNQHIEGLKEEMEEATESTKEIRSEIRAFRNKSITVHSQDKCAVCTYPVLACSFYLFPCGHLFHLDCLVSEVVTHHTQAKKRRIEEIQKQLKSFDGREEPSAAIPTDSSQNQREQLKGELDAVLAAECPYCGEIMIRSVDAPFISPSDYDEVMQSWE